MYKVEDERRLKIDDGLVHDIMMADKNRKQNIAQEYCIKHKTHTVIYYYITQYKLQTACPQYKLYSIKHTSYKINPLVHKPNQTTLYEQGVFI